MYGCLETSGNTAVPAAAKRRAVWFLTAFLLATSTATAAERFEGRFYRGEGDVEYLELLDISRRMFAPDAEFKLSREAAALKEQTANQISSPQ